MQYAVCAGCNEEFSQVAGNSQPSGGLEAMLCSTYQVICLYKGDFNVGI
jgi:hypothetical protein